MVASWFEMFLVLLLLVSTFGSSQRLPYLIKVIRHHVALIDDKEKHFPFLFGGIQKILFAYTKSNKTFKTGNNLWYTSYVAGGYTKPNLKWERNNWKPIDLARGCYILI